MFQKYFYFIPYEMYVGIIRGRYKEHMQYRYNLKEKISNYSFKQL